MIIYLEPTDGVQCLKLLHVHNFYYGLLPHQKCMHEVTYCMVDCKVADM